MAINNSYPIATPATGDILIGSKNLGEDGMVTKSFTVGDILSLGDGAPGPQGPPGPRGLQGIVWRGLWNDDSDYDPSDAVEYNGSSYICTAQTTLLPPTANLGSWDLLAQKGAQGATGLRGLVWRGAWSDDNEYDIGDAVEFSGSSYICVVTITNTPNPNPVQDGTKWDLLAQEGAEGIGYSLTSASSNIVSIGSKNFTVSKPVTESAYRVGNRVRVTFDINNYMEGVITSYTGDALILDVDYELGSGFRNSWTFSIAGEQGEQGPAGSANYLEFSVNLEQTDTFAPEVVRTYIDQISIGSSLADPLYRGFLASRVGIGTYRVGFEWIKLSSSAIPTGALEITMTGGNITVVQEEIYSTLGTTAGYRFLVEVRDSAGDLSDDALGILFVSGLRFRLF